MNKTKPNFELLKDAYQIIGGIPDAAFNLNNIVRRTGESLECGTVACAFGWLGMHPDFKNLMNPEEDTTKHSYYGIHWNIDGNSQRFYVDAAKALFRLNNTKEAKNLFGSTGFSEYDKELRDAGKRPSHKELFLGRVKMFLKEHGQLTNPNA